jgi:hypothetical protein
MRSRNVETGRLVAYRLTTLGILRSGGGFAISLKQQVKLGFANSRSFERQATILQMPLLCLRAG